jgi:Holliday junction resolvase-like predicted endonuclease
MAVSSEMQGRMGEAVVASEFTKQGYDVFTPAFGTTGCDMVIVRDSEVKRVEVKTCRNMVNSGRYEVFLTRKRNGKAYRFDASKSDVLAVCVLPTGRVHLLDANEYDGRRSVTVDG